MKIPKEFLKDCVETEIEHKASRNWFYGLIFLVLACNFVAPILSLSYPNDESITKLSCYLNFFVDFLLIVLFLFGLDKKYVNDFTKFKKVCKLNRKFVHDSEPFSNLDKDEEKINLYKNSFDTICDEADDQEIKDTMDIVNDIKKRYNKQ